MENAILYYTKHKQSKHKSECIYWFHKLVVWDIWSHADHTVCPHPHVHCTEEFVSLWSLSGAGFVLSERHPKRARCNHLQVFRNTFVSSPFILSMLHAYSKNDPSILIFWEQSEKHASLFLSRLTFVIKYCITIANMINIIFHVLTLPSCENKANVWFFEWCRKPATESHKPPCFVPDPNLRKSKGKCLEKQLARNILPNTSPIARAA